MASSSGFSGKIARSPEFRHHPHYLTLKLQNDLFYSGPAEEQYEYVKCIVNSQFSRLRNAGLIDDSFLEHFDMSLKESQGEFTGEVFLRFVDKRICYFLQGLDVNGNKVTIQEEQIRKKSWAVGGATEKYTTTKIVPTFVPIVVTQSYMGYEGPVDEDGNIVHYLNFTPTIIDRNKYEEKHGKRLYQEADSLVTSVLPKGTTIEEIMFFIEDITESCEIDGVKYPHGQLISSKKSDLQEALKKNILLKEDFDEEKDNFDEKVNTLSLKYQKALIVFAPGSSEAAFVKQILHRNKIDGKGIQSDKTFDVFFSRECKYSEPIGEKMSYRSSNRRERRKK